MTEKNMISVFYACDDCFARYTAVSLHSLAIHADPRKQYRIHILHAGLSEQTQRMLLEEENAV